jgi:hypothetical protein
METLAYHLPLGRTVFKYVARVESERALTLLRRLRLYHPPLSRLADLSQGSDESLQVRSAEFSSLLNDVLVNGVWKRTGQGRLVGLDQWIVPHLRRSSDGLLAMLEVGGSDGTTTVDTLDYLAAKLGVVTRATILEMQFRLRRFRRGPVEYYLTNDGHPLIIQCGRLGALFEETKAREGLLVNPLIRLAVRVLRRSRLERYMTQREDLLFESPLVRNDPRIEWVERDLFELSSTLAHSFDLIRCCNVLNLGYFAEERIREGLQTLSGYLKTGGLLLVGRSVDGAKSPIECASLWRSTLGGMRHVSDLNGGSEVKHLIPT